MSQPPAAVVRRGCSTMTDQKLLDAYHQLGRLSSTALDEEKFIESAVRCEKGLQGNAKR